MSSSDFDLRVKFSASSNTDMRTFSIYMAQRKEGSEPDIRELYKFSHPLALTRLGSFGVTTFFRQNLATRVLETAGDIVWHADSLGIVHFGIDEISIRDLRRTKNANSQSRRFKVEGSEYKWKFVDNQDLHCLDSRGRTVASWSQEQLLLHVAGRVEDVLDHIVVTWMLNLWFSKLGIW